MEPRHSERLVGSAVVLILAVVFLPMLLQGPVERDRPGAGQGDAAKDTAPEAAASMAEMAPGSAPGATTAVPGVPGAGRGAATPEPVPDAVPDREAPSGADQDSDPEGAAPEPVEETPPGPETETDEPTEPDRTADGREWRVQVGSFRSASNARGLRDRLDGEGFDASVDEREVGDEALYRVRVGPVASSEAAEALKADLAGRAGLDGVVIAPGRE